MSKQNTTSQSNLSVTTTSTSDSWESRIQSAATFMGITIETVEAALKDMGVEKDNDGVPGTVMLSDEEITPFGDIRARFCDNPEYGKIPIAKVRMGMKYLRGPQGSQKTDSVDPEILALNRKYGIRMKLEDVDPSELLANYHPEQPNHPITVALKKRFGDSKVIVFKPDSTIVDIEATSNYIADLAQGYDAMETVESDGALVRLYEVGKIPNQMIEEDPLFEGKPLKRGRSTVNRVNWSGVSLQIRQRCRIIVDRGELDENDRLHVQDLMRMVNSSDELIALKELKKAYPEADLAYRELAKKNELPKLTLTMESASGKKQNPFGVGNRQF